MTTEEVRYSAMVFVTVDLDTRKVTAVLVDDQSVSLVGAASTDQGDEAIEIAEDAEWPRWRLG